MNDRWRNIEPLLSLDAAGNLGQGSFRASEYYGQLWGLLRFLQSDPRYAAGLRRLLADAAAGRLDQELNIEPTAWNRVLRDAALYNSVLSRRCFEHYIEPDLGGFDRRYPARTVRNSPACDAFGNPLAVPLSRAGCRSPPRP